MSIRSTASESAVVLYDSVTGLPLPMEVFDGDHAAEEAEAFVDFASSEGCELRKMHAEGLAALRRRFYEPAPGHDVRVPYANSMADTAAGAGSN